MSHLALESQVAIITGASRSIGAAIAKELVTQGAKVIVNYVGNDAAANETVTSLNKIREGHAVAIKADVSTIDGGKYLVAQTIKAFGAINIVVLNAGIMGNKVLADVDEEFFDQHFNVNVKGPFFLVQSAVPHMKSGGRVIFFSTSLTAASTVVPTALTYVSTKGAVEQLSRVLAKELGAKGITVNVISPGPVDTPLFRQGKTEQMIQGIANQAPSHRIGLPEEIAPAVAFLASPAASWVSSQNLRVNGGMA